MQTWPEGYGRRVLGEVDSTNAEAARLSATLAGPTWILAQAQSAGRARRGRGWVSPIGNFYATLVMRPEGATATLALRSFIASLALSEALEQVSGRVGGFALKWPNDVLLNGGKLAGILLESAGGAGQPSHLCIGIGVNLSHAPDARDLEQGALRPVSLVSETGISVAPLDLLLPLAAAYAHWEQQFRDFGFAPVRAAWLARAARLGEVITARVGTSRTTGRFETVDADGHLVLSVGGTRVAIPAADVFF